MKELRFHGRREPRYDRVAPFVAAPRLLAEAALREGKHVQFRPPWLFLRGFTPETALLRVDREPIETYQQESFLDAVVVTDPTLLSEVNVVTGLKAGGLLLVNGEGSPALTDQARVVTRDLTRIAKAHRAELTPALGDGVDWAGLPKKGAALCLGSLPPCEVPEAAARIQQNLTQSSLTVDLSAPQE